MGAPLSPSIWSFWADKSRKCRPQTWLRSAGFIFSKAMFTGPSDRVKCAQTQGARTPICISGILGGGIYSFLFLLVSKYKRFLIAECIEFIINIP